MRIDGVPPRPALAGRAGPGFDGALSRARRAEGGRPARAIGDPGARAETIGPGAPAPPVVVAPAAGGPVPPPELAAAVRAVAPAVAAARCAGGPLALSFGRALEVELRSSPAGVEVVLRPDARLVRAAEADLPGLVAALRGRGIVVARAEVRPRGGRGRAR